MSRTSLASFAFHSAASTLRGAVQERVARRLTPPAPPPRDSDPTMGDALPSHPPSAPPVSAWSSGVDDESDDGDVRR